MTALDVEALVDALDGTGQQRLTAETPHVAGMVLAHLAAAGWSLVPTTRIPPGDIPEGVTAPDDIPTLLARAQSQLGRCHRCAFLRQEHRPDMGHRIEDRMAVSPSEVIAIAERLAEADTVVRDYPRVMAERDAARQRIAALEAAVPDDPHVLKGLVYRCWYCDVTRGWDHDPDCRWLAVRGGS